MNIAASHRTSRISQLIVASVIAMLAYSCSGSSSQKILPTSLGKPYEIVVVASSNTWQSEVGDTVRAIFSELVPMINYQEPIYDIIERTPERVNKLNVRHFNLLQIIVDSVKYKTSDMTASYREHSQDQLSVLITSPSQDSVTNFIWNHRNLIVGLYNKAENDRLVSRSADFGNKAMQKLTAAKFGITINVPIHFAVRSDQPDFLWISYELPKSSVAMVIYTFDKAATFDQIAERNAAVNKIPGPSPGSYMKTSDAFEPTVTQIGINGREWLEMRGFWNVAHDYMGGPFVNFVTSNPTNGKMIGIDCYLYSPNPHDGMRNYLRQLESLVRTIKFEGK